MALHPPSFFEAPQQHSSEGEVGRTVEGDVRSEQGVAGKAGPTNIRDEVAALRQENQDLKYVVTVFILCQASFTYILLLVACSMQKHSDCSGSCGVPFVSKLQFLVMFIKPRDLY